MSRKVRWRDKQSCLIRAPPRALQGSPMDLLDLPLAVHPSSSLPAASHPVSFPFLPPILDSTDPSIPTISRQLLFHLCCLHAAHKGSVVATGRSPKPAHPVQAHPEGLWGLTLEALPLHSVVQQRVTALPLSSSWGRGHRGVRTRGTAEGVHKGWAWQRRTPRLPLHSPKTRWRGTAGDVQQGNAPVPLVPCP